MHFGSLSKEIPTKLCKWKNFECSTAHIRQPHSDLCFLINTQTIAHHSKVQRAIAQISTLIGKSSPIFVGLIPTWNPPLTYIQ